MTSTPSSTIARKVLAAMSGGVDSAVAAALVAEEGNDVTGVTLKLWCYGTGPASPRACCTLDAIDDARRVAQRMGFPYFVVDAEEVFRERVLQPFLDAYASGRTPYPCALCNQHLKFGDLVRRMELLGADTLVTGHYARVERDAGGHPALLRARDRSKDQSYALAFVPYAALGRARFPLGSLAKEEVRDHALRLGLSVWDKPESQDLCFVPDGDYAGFMVDKLGERRGTDPGPIVDVEGRTRGVHRGLIHYTIGQRRGLGLSDSERLFVVAVEPGANRIVVGRRDALDSPGLLTEPMNWLVPVPPGASCRVMVQIRSHHTPAPATLDPAPDGRVEIRFDQPQSAVTPGQSCVIYDGEQVVGGAPIAHALGHERHEPEAAAAAGATRHAG